jgi:hypothetical protein
VVAAKVFLLHVLHAAIARFPYCDVDVANTLLCSVSLLRLNLLALRIVAESSCFGAATLVASPALAATGWSVF